MNNENQVNIQQFLVSKLKEKKLGLELLFSTLEAVINTFISDNCQIQYQMSFDNYLCENYLSSQLDITIATDINNNVVNVNIYDGGKPLCVLSLSIFSSNIKMPNEVLSPEVIKFIQNLRSKLDSAIRDMYDKMLTVESAYTKNEQQMKPIENETTTDAEDD